MRGELHVPTPQARRTAELLSANGIPQHEIAKLLRIAPHTLRKHYRAELARGSIRASAQVGGEPFQDRDRHRSRRDHGLHFLAQMPRGMA